MDIERASNIIKAFPNISKTIVDDTLYEKVLSYLTLVISTADISKLNDMCHIFQSIHKVKRIYMQRSLRFINTFFIT